MYIKYVAICRMNYRVSPCVWTLVIEIRGVRLVKRFCFRSIVLENLVMFVRLFGALDECNSAITVIYVKWCFMRSVCVKNLIGGVWLAE